MQLCNFYGKTYKVSSVMCTKTSFTSAGFYLENFFWGGKLKLCMGGAHSEHEGFVTERCNIPISYENELLSFGRKLVSALGKKVWGGGGGGSWNVGGGGGGGGGSFPSALPSPPLG